MLQTLVCARHGGLNPSIDSNRKPLYIATACFTSASVENSIMPVRLFPVILVHAICHATIKARRAPTPREKMLHLKIELVENCCKLLRVSNSAKICGMGFRRHTHTICLLPCPNCYARYKNLLFAYADTPWQHKNILAQVFNESLHQFFTTNIFQNVETKRTLTRR